MKCRGQEVRRQIVANYRITPIAHIQLLAGQKKRSDAEAIITNDYYIFEAIDNSGRKEIIQCGMGAANDFLHLINHAGLPLFNPLQIERNGGGHGGVNPGVGGNGNHEQDWNPTAKQLYNAIMWLIIAWDAQPGTPLFEFKNDVINYKNYEPYAWKIKRVNTTIRNGGHGQTLTEIINDFRGNNNIRDDMCQFDLLINVINRITDKDGNGIESFF